MPGFHLPPQQRRLLVAAVGAILLVVVGVRHVSGHAPAAPVVEPVRVRAHAPAARAPTPVVVDVVGAVRRPGLYRLRQGGRVADAVARAGGLARAADPIAINLAAPLVDGQQVVVPARIRGAPAGAAAAGAAALGEAAPGTPAAASAPVDLNTATLEQLDTLPGVGPVTAQKIVDYRQAHGPFTATAELDAIPGIGPARLHDLEGLVTP